PRLMSTPNPAPEDPRPLEAWNDIADAYAAAVRAGADSSRAVTERAIVSLVRQVPTGPVLDLGCGEGWLARELAAKGHEVTAIDGSPRMIELAQAAGGNIQYGEVSFAAAAEQPRKLMGAYGTIIFNFSLLDQRITPILSAAGARLFPYGRILIQAAHPAAMLGDPADYRDGWRTMEEVAPGVKLMRKVPWYFRTFTTWVLELRRAGLLLVETYEPLDPDTGRPASLMLHVTIPERRAKQPR
ncbi:MAG TPA: class I SAM-dependent methyltransferase, partial [Longimicrobiaceae bacterium]